MNKKNIGFLLLFVVALIAPTLFFVKSATSFALMFGAPIIGLLCAAVAGGLKAYMDTKDDGVLDEKERHAAIFLGIATFSIISAVILTVPLFESAHVINYYFPRFGHITEMTLRLIVVALMGSLFFAGNILSLTWLVPYIGREYHKKTTELAVAPAAAAATTPAAGGGAAGTTGTTGTTTPAAAEPKKGMGIALPFIVILVIAIILAIGFSGPGKQQPLPSTQPNVPTTQPNPQNGNGNGNGNTNPGSTFQLPNETPGQVNH